jgi:hypothetical protein
MIAAGEVKPDLLPKTLHASGNHQSHRIEAHWTIAILEGLLEEVCLPIRSQRLFISTCS